MQAFSGNVVVHDAARDPASMYCLYATRGEGGVPVRQLTGEGEGCRPWAAFGAVLGLCRHPTTLRVFACSRDIRAGVAWIVSPVPLRHM
eukprot:6910023-Prymnesium_polylepis.2